MTFKRKIAFFSLTFLVIHGLLLFINFKLNHSKNEVTIQLDQYFQRGNIKVLFLGDSHPKKAIDCSIIDSSYSIAHSGENNMMNYYKLAYCINNKKIKPQYVVLPCDILTYTKNYNYSITYKPLYYSFIPINEVFCVDSNTLKAYYDYLKINLFPYTEWKYIFNKNNLFKGADKAKRFQTESQLKQFTTNLIKGDVGLTKEHETLYFTRSLDYIQKTIDLCKQHKIKLIYIKYPTTSLFLDEVKKWSGDTSLTIRPSEKIINKHHVPLLNYESLYLKHDDFFYDSHHLNDDGKKAFSNMLKLKLDSLFVVY